MLFLSDGMDISKLEPGNKDKINVFIECLKGSKDFYRYDQKVGIFVLKKVLKSPFPGCYGFIPKTHHIDAKPLDVIVLTKEDLEQGIVLEAKPIGVIRLKNEVWDDILIAVSTKDKIFEKVHDITEVPKNVLENLKSFLEEFKEKSVEKIFEVHHAKKSIEHAIEFFKKVG